MLKSVEHRRDNGWLGALRAVPASRPAVRRSDAVLNRVVDCRTARWTVVWRYWGENPTELAGLFYLMSFPTHLPVALPVVEAILRDAP